MIPETAAPFSGLLGEEFALVSDDADAEIAIGVPLIAAAIAPVTTV